LLPRKFTNLFPRDDDKPSVEDMTAEMLAEIYTPVELAELYLETYNCVQLFLAASQSPRAIKH